MFNFAPSDWYAGLAIVVLGLSVVISRTLFMLFGDHLQLPHRMRAALRYAPVAALTAIIVPALLPWQAGAGPSFDLRLVAGIVAILVYLRTRSAVLVIVTGMLALWGLRWMGA
jgi:branched-subunit amino acid transport protein